MNKIRKILRGGIWLINFDPSVGSEVKKTRPAVIVSNDLSNSIIDRVQVIPITSNIDNVYPCECMIKSSKITGKAMADQITTVSNRRLYKKIGDLDNENMLDIERIISLQLGINNYKV